MGLWDDADQESLSVRYAVRGGGAKQASIIGRKGRYTVSWNEFAGVKKGVAKVVIEIFVY